MEPEARSVDKNLYLSLEAELTQLCTRWRIFDDLFCKGSDRKALLEHTAAWLFGSLGRILLDDLILGISRLLDPPQTGRFGNRSLERLILEVDGENECQLREALLHRLADLRDKARHITEHRRKRLAHSDLEWTSGQIRLPDIPFDDFEVVLSGAGEFLNELADRYVEAHTLYTGVILPHGQDVKGLVWALQKGAAMDEFIDTKHHGTLVQQTPFKNA